MKEMNEIDKRINDQRKKRDDLIKKKKQAREGGQSQSGGNLTVIELLKQRNSEVAKIREVKNDLGRRLKDFHGEIDELEAEKTTLLKSMNPKAHTVEAVKQAIKDLDYEMTTRTLNAN